MRLRIDPPHVADFDERTLQCLQHWTNLLVEAKPTLGEAVEAPPRHAAQGDDEQRHDRDA